MAVPAMRMRMPTTDYCDSHQPPLDEDGRLVMMQAYRSPVATGRAGSAHHSLHEPG